MKMEVMIENIREEFKNMLNENEWMDEPSKQKAREKVSLFPIKQYE